jgi:hypothetical protein
VRLGPREEEVVALFDELGREEGEGRVVGSTDETGGAVDGTRVTVLVPAGMEVVFGSAGRGRELG